MNHGHHIPALQFSNPTHTCHEALWFIKIDVRCFQIELRLHHASCLDAGRAIVMQLVCLLRSDSTTKYALWVLTHKVMCAVVTSGCNQGAFFLTVASAIMAAAIQRQQQHVVDAWCKASGAIIFHQACGAIIFLFGKKCCELTNSTLLHVDLLAITCAICFSLQHKNL